MPKLVVDGNVEQTVAKLSQHGGQFSAVIFCYLISFLGDFVLAWSLYILLAPRSRALSLLTAWF